MNAQLKLKFYYDHVLTQVYAEGESSFHRDITRDVVTRFIDPLNLPKSACILDLGCGPGYFIDAMKAQEYTNVTGLTMSIEDLETNIAKGNSVQRSDMNFLTARDETVDMLFCRHSLEHSPFPYITLLEYNRVLKPNGYLYVEVPQPDCERPHEENRNHYSILGRSMWLNLLKRTGFDVTWYDYEVPIQFPDQTQNLEKYYIFVCQRKRPVDVK
jgi:ubiquinone/menaquinone biosynthesis C-methylase UbiE